MTGAEQFQLALQEEQRIAALICGNCGRRRDEHVRVSPHLSILICPDKVFNLERVPERARRQ